MAESFNNSYILCRLFVDSFDIELIEQERYETLDVMAGPAARLLGGLARKHQVNAVENTNVAQLPSQSGAGVTDELLNDGHGLEYLKLTTSNLKPTTLNLGL